MGIPQVPEQVRRAPALALRAVFAGIGRILLSADRPEALGPALESPTAADRDYLPRQARREHRSPGIPPAQAGARWRSLDETGNVRVVSAADLDDDDFLLPVPAVELAAKFVTQPSLPLANYDSLSLASIRARLRSLDVGQLKVLLDYEAVNAERPEVLGMFERRIEKLGSAG